MKTQLAKVQTAIAGARMRSGGPRRYMAPACLLFYIIGFTVGLGRSPAARAG